MRAYQRACDASIKAANHAPSDMTVTHKSYSPSQHPSSTRGQGSPTVMIVVVVLLPVRVTLPLVRIAPVSRRRAVRRERRSLGAQDGRHSGGERSDKWSVEASAKVGRGI